MLLLPVTAGPCAQPPTPHGHAFQCITQALCYLLPSKSHHIQGSIHESPIKDLRSPFTHNNITGPVVCRDVLENKGSGAFIILALPKGKSKHTCWICPQNNGNRDSYGIQLLLLYSDSHSLWGNSWRVNFIPVKSHHISRKSWPHYMLFLVGKNLHRKPMEGFPPD